MSTSNSFQLKKPYLVWFLGCCFIIAPYANLAAALYLGNRTGWYLPSRVFEAFAAQTLATELLLLLNPLAGASLLVRRKTSWLLAVGLLICGCFQNIASALTTEHWFTLGILPLLVNSSFLIVFRYFRYPYLDRRDNILRGLSYRYDVVIPVQVDQLGGVEIHNISATGCYLEFPNSHSLPQVNSTIHIHLDDLSIEGLVLRHDKNCCAVQFQSPSRLPRAKMRQFRRRASKPNGQLKAS